MAESRSKSGMGGKSEKGEGTRVAEYIETPLQIHCETCHYLVGKKFCRQDVVAKDRQVPTDKTTGLKIIDPVAGCCRYWSPENKKDLK
jgi:hypothetical protein